MKVTLAEALYMIQRGETPEQYKKRLAKIRRLSIERDFLEDSLSILTEPEDEPKAVKKRARLAKVLQMMEELR